MFKKLILLISLFLVLSCSKEVDTFPKEKISLNTEWRPLKKGYWIEYKIDSFIYSKSVSDSLVTIIHKISFQKETVLDTFSSFGFTQYKLLSEAKMDSNATYSFQYFYKSYYTEVELREDIDDKLTVVLIAPMISSAVWNGNEYIDTSLISSFGSEYFRYKIPSSINNVGINSFDSTTMVVQYADSNAIENNYKYEVFALGVGRIFSLEQHLKKQNGANPWTKPENGIKVVKSIINWKK